MQSPFVLCRLFRKQEEKADVSKYDEVENTGSSPTATETAQVQVNKLTLLYCVGHLVGNPWLFPV